MEDITSKMVDYVVMNIEDDHLPPKFYNTIIESNDDTTIIRSDLFNMGDINQWVKDFSELTNTQWNTRDSCPQGERFICWKKFICHHSSFMKVPVTTKRSKSFNCEATLYIKIKLDNSKTRYTDPFIKVGQCAIIIIRNKHSHSLWADETLSYLPSSKSTKEKFIQYFENGLGISESCHYHRSLLKWESSEVELASGRINPSQRTVRHWYNQWRESNPVLINEIGIKIEKFTNSECDSLNSGNEELENVTESPTELFEQILNSTADVVGSDKIEDSLVSSCMKISTPYIIDFKGSEREKEEDWGISHLINLNSKINQQLETSNYLESQIHKEMKTQNDLKLKKLKFTCIVKKIDLSCIYS